MRFINCEAVLLAPGISPTSWNMSMSLEPFIFLGGVLHFGILIASALTPNVLDWRRELAKLTLLSRQLIWVHGAFIVLVIIAFGVLATCFSAELASGSALARGMCAFVALFWGARLGVQFIVFDATAYLTTAFLKTGYHALTFVFVYLAAVFAIAAVLPA
jgi:hypothetical protein